MFLLVSCLFSIELVSAFSGNYSSNIIVSSGGYNIGSLNYLGDFMVGTITGIVSSGVYSSSLGFFYGVDYGNVPENPIPELTSVDGENKTNSDLNCSSFIYDIDADVLNVSVEWYLDGELNLSVSYNNNYPNGTLFSAILDSENTTKSDVWKCGMRLYDGKYYSDWANSSELTILNTLPNITLESPEDNNITTNRTPLFTWVGYDADGDALTYDINITCYDGCSDDSRLVNSLSESNYTVVNYLKYLADNGFYYNWSVRASDGENGNWSEMRRVDINALVDISMIQESINFGILLNGESKNTTEDDPSPFEMRNQGNCFTNVSVNATEIFKDYSMPTPYFKIKVDNSTLEPGAFNSETTILNWINTPITDTFLIGEMNFSDDRNELEVEVYVEVPNDEGYGDKSSTLFFTGELGE